MSLVTPADLRVILEVPGDVNDASLQAFIDTADLVVTEDLAGKGLSDARLTQIEKWIAAHFSLMLTERGGLTSSRVERTIDTYTNLSALGNAAIGGLQLTRYGQQAILLDTTGTLLKLSKQALPAQFRVMGPSKDCG